MSLAPCRVAIVGAGLAGLETARWAATERRGDVVVIEAGPLADTAHVNVARNAREALSLWLQDGVDAHFWRGWDSAYGPHYQGQSGLRRRVGGRSLYWYGVCLPLEDWALSHPHWPREVVGDLREAWNGGPPLYASTEALLNAAGCTPPPPRAPVAFGGHEFTLTPRRLRTLPGDQWSPYSPLDAWRHPAGGELSMSRLPFELLAETEAVALDLSGGHVHGVWLRRTGSGEAPCLLRAEHVVLAAAPLESARLALATGALGDAPRPVCDHLVTGLLAGLTPQPAAALAERLGWGEHLASYPQARSNLFLTLTPRPDGGALVDAQLTGEQLPGTHSTVALGRDGRLVVRAEPSVADRRVLGRQQRALQDLWAAMSATAGLRESPVDFAEYGGDARGNDCFLSPPLPGTALTWSNTLGTEDHESGTLAFGDVLDASGEIASLPGVFVAGSAAFPRAGAANPALTILALARRLGTTVRTRICDTGLRREIVP